MLGKRPKNLFTRLGSVCFWLLPILGIYQLLFMYLINGNLFQTDKRFIFVLLGLFSTGVLFKIVGQRIKTRTQKQVPKKSILTLGKVMSVRETGPYVDGYPQIAVTVKYELLNGKKLFAECNNQMTEEQLSAFKPGAFQLIRYSEEEPEKITLVALEGQSENLEREFHQYLLSKGLITKELLEVMETGEVGKAIILDSTSTGNLIQRNPEFFIHLHVTKANGEHYETQQIKVVLPECIDQLTLGKVVEVKYAPDNPDLVAVKTRFSFLNNVI